MKIIDTHAHYYHAKYRRQPNILTDMHDSGVLAIVNVATNTQSIKEVLDISKKYNFSFPVIGYFPCDVLELENNPYLFQNLKELCGKYDVVGIGEIGLDYHWDKPARNIQKKWFEKQIELATELSLPICVHSRDAESDTMEILRKHPDAFGVIHCYSYGVDTAKELISMGYYLGVGGTSTYNSATETKNVIKMAPLDRIVVETDAPYLTPSMWRGKTNRSEYLSEVVENISNLKGCFLEHVELQLIENSKKLYNIK